MPGIEKARYSNVMMKGNIHKRKVRVTTQRSSIVKSRYLNASSSLNLPSLLSRSKSEASNKLIKCFRGVCKNNKTLASTNSFLKAECRSKDEAIINLMKEKLESNVRMTNGYQTQLKNVYKEIQRACSLMCEQLEVMQKAMSMCDFNVSHSPQDDDDDDEEDDDVQDSIKQTCSEANENDEFKDMDGNEQTDADKFPDYLDDEDNAKRITPFDMTVINEETSDCNIDNELSEQESDNRNLRPRSQLCLGGSTLTPQFVTKRSTSRANIYNKFNSYNDDDFDQINVEFNEDDLLNRSAECSEKMSAAAEDGDDNQSDVISPKRRRRRKKDAEEIVSETDRKSYKFFQSKDTNKYSGENHLHEEELVARSQVYNLSNMEETVCNENQNEVLAESSDKKQRKRRQRNAKKGGKKKKKQPVDESAESLDVGNLRSADGPNAEISKNETGGNVCSYVDISIVKREVESPASKPSKQKRFSLPSRDSSACSISDKFSATDVLKDVNGQHLNRSAITLKSEVVDSGDLICTVKKSLSDVVSSSMQWFEEGAAAAAAAGDCNAVDLKQNAEVTPSNRPSRKVKPVSLKEPSLNKKLRRDKSVKI